MFLPGACMASLIRVPRPGLTWEVFSGHPLISPLHSQNDPAYIFCLLGRTHLAGQASD
jgi:hypothetical protein